MCNNNEVDINTIKQEKFFYAHANCQIDIAPFEEEIIWINVNHSCKTFNITQAGKSKVADIVTEKSDNKIPIILINPLIRQLDIIATVSPVEIVDEIQNSSECITFLKKEVELFERYTETIRCWTG